MRREWHLLNAAWGTFARERLRSLARLPDKPEAAGAGAELRTDRGDHRRCAAARGAARLLVGQTAQPAGEDTAARGVPGRRLHRNASGGRQEREVQADEAGAGKE